MGYEQAPRYRARPRRLLRGLAALVGVPLLVCGVGAAGLGAWTFQSVRGAEVPAREAADGFLRELTTGDLPAAYGRLCARTRERMGQEGFAEWARRQPAVARYTLAEVDISAGRDGLTATVTAELTWASGVRVVQPVPLRNDGGAWRVCGDPL